MIFHVYDDLIELLLLRFQFAILQVKVLLEDEHFLLGALEFSGDSVSTGHAQFKILIFALIVLNFNLCVFELPLERFLDEE